MRVFVLVILFLITGCATSTPLHRDSHWAAAADVATTSYGLNHGLREANPLGFWGTTAAKAAYLFLLRPQMDEAALRAADRMTSAFWWGASANNVLQIMFPHLFILGAGVGVAVGFHLYDLDEPAP